jgi:hypothetical protein
MDLTKSRLTSRDSEYATCALSYATLRIYSDTVTPEAMTAKLGVQPDWTTTQGFPHKLPSGRMQDATVSSWLLSSKGQVVSKDLRDHLDWLLDRLRPAASGLSALQADEVRMEVWCRWDSASGHGGPTLEPEQMRLMAELNLQCGFDIYFAGDEEEPETL